MDLDHSETISQNEFFGGLGVLASGDLEQKAKLVFALCDRNNDGKLTKKEFAKAISNIMSGAQRLRGQQPADMESQVFASLLWESDKDANGFISSEVPIVISLLLMFIGVAETV